jgi:hypothetical protein
MFVFCLFITFAIVNSFTPYIGDNRKPFYVNNPSKTIKHDPVENLDYEIPKWVYKKVFKHNKLKRKFKETDYYHAMRPCVLPKQEYQENKN